MDVYDYFTQVAVLPGLKGIETLVEPPMTLPEIAEVKQFYPGITGSFDTSSAIVWYQGQFKVTANFPWRSIKASYLERTVLGDVISILPSEYGQLHDSEFCLLHPIDCPEKTYAIYVTKILSRRDYTEREIQSMEGGIIGEGIPSAEEAKKHPFLLALFQENQQALEEMVSWLESKGEWEGNCPLGIYIQDPKKPSALLLNWGGLDRGFDIEGRCGFDEEKYFLKTKEKP